MSVFCLGAVGFEALLHDLDCGFALVNHDEVAFVFACGLACGAAACEEVHYGFARVGVDADDALKNSQGFLGGVAGLFFAGGGDDGVPPDVGGSFAASGFFCADEARSHVGDAVAGFEIEGVAGWMSCVPEDVVVFGGPPFGGAGSVVVGPDDLVLEAVAAEDFVEHDFAVVDLAVVDVEEERAGGGEDAVGFDHAGAEEAEEVVEGVSVTGCSGMVDDVGAVAPAAEADAVAGLVADGLDLLSALPFACVEGRIDVDEFDGPGFHRLQYT